MIPSQTESARLLLSLDPPIWHLRHSRAVAEIAAWLAAAAERHGRPIDPRLVSAAALLHDVDKLATIRDQVQDLPHGAGSAAWLAARGYPELGPPIECHPVTRFADDGWFDRWIASATPEELAVAYADKRAGQRLESMAERFASWERRYPPERGGDGWSRETIAAVRARAEELERRTCSMAGVRPEDVRRLPWTAAAIRRAAA